MNDYFTSEAVNMSTLKWMAKSPAHYLEAHNGRKDTAALARGRAGHLAVLEPERFECQTVVCDIGRDTKTWALFESLRRSGAAPAIFSGKVRNGKAWEAFRDAATESEIVLESEWIKIAPLLEDVRAGRQILTRAEYEHACALRDAVHAHPRAHELLQGGRPEVDLYWVDEVTGIDCKGRVDYLARNDLIDLKFTRDATVRAFARQSYELGTHMQLAFYVDGLRASTGCDSGPWIVSCESARPHDVVVYRVPSDVVEQGRTAYRELLEKLKACVEADDWPGMAPDVLDFELPIWALNVADDPGLALGGESL